MRADSSGPGSGKKPRTAARLRLGLGKGKKRADVALKQLAGDDTLSRLAPFYLQLIDNSKTLHSNN